MTNETIKREIRKILKKEDIIINCVIFSKVKREEEKVSIVDNYFYENNIEYMGLLLDI